MRSVCDLMVDDQATPFLKHASELLGYMPVEGLGTVPSDFIVTRVVRAAPHVVLRMEPSPAFILWLAEQVARMQKDGDHRPAD